MRQCWQNRNYIGNISWEHSEKTGETPWILKMTLFNSIGPGLGVITPNLVWGARHSLSNVWGCHYPPPLTPVGFGFNLKTFKILKSQEYKNLLHWYSHETKFSSSQMCKKSNSTKFRSNLNMWMPIFKKNYV